jgi:hypothetical protein
MSSAFGRKAGEMVTLNFPTKCSKQSKSHGVLEDTDFIFDVIAGAGLKNCTPRVVNLGAVGIAMT